MTDLIVALGLVLVIEGSLLTLFPDRLKKVMVLFMGMTPQQMRVIGLTLAILGFLVVGLVRGK